MKTTTKALGDVTMAIAVAAAKEYLRVHSLRADSGALAECISSWVKAKLPEALRDAKEALDCGMEQIAQSTFRLSISQAGIEAAKECAMPDHANN